MWPEPAQVGRHCFKLASTHTDTQNVLAKKTVVQKQSLK